MNDLNKLKKDYAGLIIKSGINIQKGQRLLITCPIECADFARMCASVAYDEGCSEVLMEWEDDELSRMKFMRAADEVFDRVDQWRVDRYDTLADEGAAFLSIHSEDPDNLNGVDPDRIMRAEICTGRAFESSQKMMMRNEVLWNVCSVPSDAWAAKIFPEMDVKEAVQRLWQEIFKACRVDGENSIKNWEEHSGKLLRRVDKMNEYNFKSLRYRNSAGTDATVDLPEGHLWIGGEEMSTGGIPFSANIPSEEIFTLPDRRGVNGTLVATKPLSHSGTVIDGFRFTIREGKIVEVHADRGEEVLKNAIAVDEGASYLGEVALVPHDSPISESGILFYNTLYDENASCHFAFGEAYQACMSGAEDMTEEELDARGVNSSITHVDFMIGSADLEITGITREGEEIPVFINGNFAF